ncbi:MAG: dihydrolipoyl dehydrogenase [Lachnospiraceae bacterium]
MEQYDLLIIGTGPGGYTAAEKAAKGGMKVAVIEKNEIGGVCVNRGCIPTKALIHASDLYADMRNSQLFGITAEKVDYDSTKVYEYKDRVVSQTGEEIQGNFLKLGITIIRGTARLVWERLVEVTGKDGQVQEVTADIIILAVGAKPVRPNIRGIDLPGVVTSDEILSTETDQYEDVIIIGGGVVGIECGNILHGFGSKITILESKPRILSPMDPEISENLMNYIRKQGVEIHTNSLIQKITKGVKLDCTYIENGEEKHVSAGHILVSVGRKFSADGLFADEYPIKMEDGHIAVDSNFKTNMEGIYAIGDAIHGIQLAHVAAAQGTFVIEHILKKEPSIMLSIVPSCLFIDLPIVPNCLYLNPEVASVGLSENEAREKGLNVRCGKYTIDENSRAIITHDSVGFIKVVFEATSDVLIGAQMVCARATDMIGEMATAIANSLTSKQLMYAMRAHPTYNEAIAKAVENSQEKK